MSLVVLGRKFFGRAGFGSGVVSLVSSGMVVEEERQAYITNSRAGKIESSGVLNNSACTYKDFLYRGELQTATFRILIFQK